MKLNIEIDMGDPNVVNLINVTKVKLSVADESLTDNKPVMLRWVEDINFWAGANEANIKFSLRTPRLKTNRFLSESLSGDSFIFDESYSLVSDTFSLQELGKMLRKELTEAKEKGYLT